MIMSDSLLRSMTLQDFEDFCILYGMEPTISAGRVVRIDRI